MAVRCVALLSGGLDSMLAIRLMQEQGIEVEALNFKTIFTCCQDVSAHAARELGVRLTVVTQDDDYLDLVRRPRFGYGKGANPCVDCRIYMFQIADRFMRDAGARFVVSGEVVGQRPMSQKRRDLDIISHHSGLKDLLLRPLSAKLLPPTLPEREGIVDREKLCAVRGRSRKELIELADRLGVTHIPTPSTGCALTEPQFGRKVHDLVQLDPGAQRWDFELLKTGRHFRHSTDTKVVLGRNEAENETLRYMHSLPEAASRAHLEPHNFLGPTDLVIGPPTHDAIAFASGLILRYAKHYDPLDAQVRVDTAEGSHVIRAEPTPESDDARTLATV